MLDGKLHDGNVDEDLRWLANQINQANDGVDDAIEFKDVEGDYTLELEDERKWLNLTNTLACPPKILTIPHSSSVHFRVGRTFIMIEQVDIGQYQIVGAEGVTVNFLDGWDSTRGRGACAVLVKKAEIEHEAESVIDTEDVWTVAGALDEAEEESV